MIIIFFYPADNKFMLSSTSVWMFPEFSQLSFDKIILQRKATELHAMDHQGWILGDWLGPDPQYEAKNQPWDSLQGWEVPTYGKEPKATVKDQKGKQMTSPAGEVRCGSGSQWHSSPMARVDLDTRQPDLPFLVQQGSSIDQGIFLGAISPGAARTPVKAALFIAVQMDLRMLIVTISDWNVSVFCGWEWTCEVGGCEGVGSQIWHCRRFKYQIWGTGSFIA